MSQDSKYEREDYWSEVGERIDERAGDNVIAGDDEPFYRYKRAKLKDMLRELAIEGKSVLEIGPGPGGNLKLLNQKNPSRLAGADISSTMIALAKKNIGDEKVELHKTDGHLLPFANGEFDLVFSCTVLQHNTEEGHMERLLKEMCRVSGHEVVLFEQTHPTLKGDELCYWRPVSYYTQLAESHGYELVDTDYIDIYTSYLVAGFSRKVLNPKSRQEGEPLTPFSLGVQKVFMPITKALDRVIKPKTDLAKMTFRRKS